MHRYLIRQLKLLAFLSAPFFVAGGAAAADPVSEELTRIALQCFQQPSASPAGGEKGANTRTELDALAAKYPKDPRVRLAQGEYFWRIGNQAEAEANWRLAEKLDPANAPALNHLGNCAIESGDAAAAAGYYKRAVTAGPGVALFHFNYANVLFLFRRELISPEEPTADAVMDRALLEYSEAARLQPLDENYQRAYGETFFAVKNPDWRRALAAWRQYAEISANKDFAMSNLARVHLALGEKNEALECIAQIQDEKFSVMKKILERRAKAADQ